MSMMNMITTAVSMVIVIYYCPTYVNNYDIFYLPLKDTFPVTFSIGQHMKKQPGY